MKYITRIEIVCLLETDKNPKNDPDVLSALSNAQVKARDAFDQELSELSERHYTFVLTTLRQRRDGK